MEFSPRRTLSSLAFYRRKNAVRKDSDQHSGDDSGHEKRRQIIEQFAVLYHESRHADLRDIVRHASCNTYAGDTKALDVFQQKHHKKAQKPAGKAVKDGHSISEQIPHQKNAGDGNHQDFPCRKEKEADDYNQIGNAEFDSRNTEVDRDQYLHVTENHGKCHQHGA